MILIADTESDGFVEEATKVWCVSSITYEGSDDEVVHFGPSSINRALDYLGSCSVLCGHNWIDHDLPLLKKLYDWTPRPDQIIVDTLVFSRLLHPARPRPYGYTGQATHSVEAWGYRLGRGKPEHEDWTRYSEEMKVRCNEDAIINRLILWELEKEADENKLYFHKDV